jgi:hypothetical protein
MYELPRRKCESPRRVGLLLAALLLVAATRGFCGEAMGKVPSIANVVTVVGDSEPVAYHLDCYWWPAPQADGSSPTCTLGVKGSVLLQLPSSDKLWVGLVSDAPAASWTLEVSSAYAAEEDWDWEAIDTWEVDSVADNRIGSLAAGVENKWFCAQSSVPAPIVRQLKTVDGSNADELSVRLDSNPSGKAACRVVVFARGSRVDE